MESVFFLFGLMGVVLVIHWAVVNDRAGNHGKTTGLFAMRDAQTETPKPGPRPPIHPSARPPQRG